MAVNTLKIEIVWKDKAFKNNLKELESFFSKVNKQLQAFTKNMLDVCQQTKNAGAALCENVSADKKPQASPPDQKKDKEAEESKAPLSFAEGWTEAFATFETGLCNWKELASKGFESVKENLASVTSQMINQIGEGWDGIHQIVQNAGELILQSVIDMLGKMVSEWITKTLVIAGVEKAWATLKIALGLEVAAVEDTTRAESLAKTLAADSANMKSAAGVGAARAAAASAWSVWGAIAIGAAIGAAIMAFAGSFAAGGIVPGHAFSGDRMLARVNSGEMILNEAQQARLFDIASGYESVRAPGGGAVINQTINVSGAGDLAAITRAIKRGTSQALELANVTYKAGKKQNKYVG